MSPEVIADVVVGTIKRAVAPVLAQLATTNARLAALEERGETPLPAGPPGPQGPPGINGRDGTDGTSIEDVAIEYDGNRSIAFRVTRGGVVKTFPVALPFMAWQGAYQEGYPYVVGDVVQCGGNAWHCMAPTTLRPGTSVNAWRLMVRKGRDGRDVPAQ